MNRHEWQDYQRREQRKRRLEAIGAWTVMMLAAVGAAAILWIVLSFAGVAL